MLKFPPFSWLAALARTVRDAWRDIRELSQPFHYTDVAWKPITWSEADDQVTTVPPTSQYDYARFGKCDLCEREVWYRFIYTSAGYPVACFLCLSHSLDMVQTSPHILVCTITVARSKWCKEQASRNTRGQ